jgi:hypothetical protein
MLATMRNVSLGSLKIASEQQQEAVWCRSEYVKKMFDVLSSGVLDRAPCTSVFLLEDEYRYLIHFHTFEAHKMGILDTICITSQDDPCLESLLKIADDVCVICSCVSKSTLQKKKKVMQC